MNLLNVIAASRRRVSYDADAQAWFAAVEAAGSSITDPNKAAVSAFVAGCKADGIWSAIKACCLLCAADTLTGALVPLVGAAPTNNGFVSGDYSRTTGLKANGTTGSKTLSSNRPGNTDPQNNKHIAVYSTVPPSAGRRAYFGEYDGISIKSWVRTEASGAPTGGVNSAVSFAMPTLPAVAGLCGVRRVDASGFSYLVHGASGFATVTSTAPIAAETTIFGQRPLAGGGEFFTDARLSFYSIGESLDLARLDARLTTLMAALT